MTKVTPAIKHKIVKKRTKSFERHQHQLFWRIGRSSWRKQKGLDSRVRRRFKGTIPQPRIGYGEFSASLPHSPSLSLLLLSFFPPFRFFFLMMIQRLACCFSPSASMCFVFCKKFKLFFFFMACFLWILFDTSKALTRRPATCCPTDFTSSLFTTPESWSCSSCTTGSIQNGNSWKTTLFFFS